MKALFCSPTIRMDAHSAVRGSTDFRIYVGSVQGLGNRLGKPTLRLFGKRWIATSLPGKDKTVICPPADLTESLCRPIRAQQSIVGGGADCCVHSESRFVVRIPPEPNSSSGELLRS